MIESRFSDFSVMSFYSVGHYATENIVQSLYRLKNTVLKYNRKNLFNFKLEKYLFHEGVSCEQAFAHEYLVNWICCGSDFG